jgi:Uma2 family endonuclease
MVMQAEEKRYYEPDEYLELEVASNERHEYIDGEIILMTGGTPNHNQIVANLCTEANLALKRQPYRVFVTDQRLWIPKKRLYTYPDILIVQGGLEYQTGRRDTITNPLFIAEVLSSSTRSYDKDGKFAAYRTIPSFQEYLLVDQYTMHVEQYFKTDANHWMFSEYEGAIAKIPLRSIPFEIELMDLYDKVEFAPIT